MVKSKRFKEEKLEPMKTIEFLSTLNRATLIEVVDEKYNRLDYLRVGEIDIDRAKKLTSGILYLNKEVLSVSLFLAQTSPEVEEPAAQIIVRA